MMSEENNVSTTVCSEDAAANNSSTESIKQDIDIENDNDDNSMSEHITDIINSPPLLFRTNLSIIYNIGTLVLITTDSSKTYLTQEEMNEPVIIYNDQEEGSAIVIDTNAGTIDWYDTTANIRKLYDFARVPNKYDANMGCVMPGFVDAHTHLPFSGNRIGEFLTKLGGDSTYMQIHNAGGGIHYTVNETIKALPTTEFTDMLVARLSYMNRCGTTTAECKSGYALTTDGELELLKVIKVLNDNYSLHGVKLSPTYCGAHAVPLGKTAKEQANCIINEQLPLIKEKIDSGEITVDSIDVFCERGVFDTDTSRRILLAGKEYGFRINFHGDELNPTKSAEMGVEIGAHAISHLEHISDAGIEAMAQSKTFAIILPTTLSVLPDLPAPPVRKLIDSGVPVALGTDFNPNAFCMNMMTAMRLAVDKRLMKPNEALVAATFNAAGALGLSHEVGSIQIGKQADLIVLREKRWENILYQMGNNDIIKCVFSKGHAFHEGADRPRLI